MTSAVIWAWLVAIGLWAVPIFVVFSVRSRRDRPLSEIALGIPFAVAIDLLSVLTLTRFVHLETAALISRPAWIVGGVSVAFYQRFRHGTHIEWPRALRWKELLAPLLAMGITIVSFSSQSYQLVIWDMEWHGPLVASIGSQKLPFVNVLSGKDVLHYHFSGDAYAAVLRALSGNVISGVRALHTVHDLMFASAAATATLLAMGLGLKRFWPAVLAGLGVVFLGPIAMRGNVGHAFDGYAYFLSINVGYRPHIPVAALLLVGILGATVWRAVRPELATRRTAPVLLSLVALLAVTDEASTALVGLGLGVAWLVDYRLIAPRRWAGLGVLFGLLFGLVSTNTLFAASLSKGSPVQAVSWDWLGKIPSCYPGEPAHALSEIDGAKIFFWDFLPVIAGVSALTLLALRLRARTYVGLAAFAWAVFVVAATLVTHVQINHTPSESQRFFMAPFYVALVVSILLLDRMPRGSAASLLVLLGVAVPAVLAVYFEREGLGVLEQTRDGKGGDRAFDLNCRATFGAHFGETAAPTFVEPRDFVGIVGCRPIFQFGNEATTWHTRLYPVTDAINQLRGIDEQLLSHDARLDAICREDREGQDPVCAVATKDRSRCQKEGRYLRCPLTRGDRDSLLGRKASSGS